MVFATRMMLAFLLDQVQQLCCALFRAVWAKLGSKRLLWERMRALFYDYRLESMRELLEALFYGLEKSHPIVRAHRPRSWDRPLHSHEAPSKMSDSPLLEVET